VEKDRDDGGGSEADKDEEEPVFPEQP